MFNVILPLGKLKPRRVAKPYPFAAQDISRRFVKLFAAQDISRRFVKHHLLKL
jgi:hypothetical protein